MSHPIFAKLDILRQALSAALDIANLENEVKAAIEELEKYDEEGYMIDSPECDALYSLEESLNNISQEIDNIETSLLDLSASKK